jgi:hypothetical protein
MVIEKDLKVAAMIYLKELSLYVTGGTQENPKILVELPGIYTKYLLDITSKYERHYCWENPLSGSGKVAPMLTFN